MPFSARNTSVSPSDIFVEHKAHWAIKQLNFDLDTAGEKRLLDIDELDEIRLSAYDLSKDYKLQTKKYHDSHVVPKSFEVGQKVLCYQSRLHLHLGKLNTRWASPFIVTRVFDHGAIELLDRKDNSTSKVNGHRLKPYFELGEEVIEDIELVDFVYDEN